MNISTGTLIVNGDVTSTINQYISNGWITAYGGSGSLNVDYNVTNPGKTTVTATPPGQEPSPTDWTNSSGDRLWRTPANWYGGAVPTLSDKAAIRNDTISGPIIDASTTAEANTVVVGDWDSTNDTLDMTGGTLTTNEWLILAYDSNNSGTFTMSDGTVNVGNDLYVGFAGIGNLDITGGFRWLDYGHEYIRDSPDWRYGLRISGWRHYYEYRAQYGNWRRNGHYHGYTDIRRRCHDDYQ
jgi:hypothetical protein